MHGQPVVAPVLQERLARVQAHPNADSRPSRPILLSQGALGIDRGPDGVRGTLEGEEECVPLSIDLDAVMPFDGLTHQAAMQAQDRSVLAPEAAVATPSTPRHQ